MDGQITIVSCSAFMHDLSYIHHSSSQKVNADVALDRMMDLSVPPINYESIRRSSIRKI
jgi:hypothetical protein